MIYERIKSLCDKNGISIAKLESKCGIGNGSIGKWNDDKTAPRLATLEKIATEFGMTLSELLEGVATNKKSDQKGN
jgi:transcriptional regulator with XRE-family HTH domain